MNILFLCVASSARSQMAERIAKRVLGEEHAVMSTELGPTQVHHLAILEKEIATEDDINEG